MFLSGHTGWIKNFLAGPNVKNAPPLYDCVRTNRQLIVVPGGRGRVKKAALSRRWMRSCEKSRTVPATEQKDFLIVPRADHYQVQDCLYSKELLLLPSAEQNGRSQNISNNPTKHFFNWPPLNIIKMQESNS